MSGLFRRFFLYCFFLWKILLANDVNPYQTPHDVASDLGLHCLPMTRLRVSRYYEWVKALLFAISLNFFDGFTV